ncbi:MAG: OmpA family protein [Bacteroidota bacterium]
MSSFKNILAAIILIFFSNYLLAQGKANIWYFGQNAGVDFRSGKPQALTNGALSTEEGVATICDAQGKLLFYTDGISVWNAEHRKMPNGQDLMGHPSSTQSGVAIPAPNPPGHYFLFTVTDQARNNGFRYSQIDMQLDKGKGDVVEDKKNILLRSPVTEKLTAVKHRNQKDTWVIVHGWNDNKFYAYLVNEEGVNQEPVISAVGSIHQGSSLNTQGYLKANPDGSNLALALEADHAIELFDFDNASGKVSRPLRAEFPDESYPYGIAFSPNASVLYVSAAGPGKIYQFDLQAGSDEKIIASRKLIGQSPEGRWVGALQVAPDGKIYFPIYDTSYLGVIHQPNQLGAACNFQNNYVDLQLGIAQLGLPTFDQSAFQDISPLAEKEISFFDQNKIEKNKTFVLQNLEFTYAQYDIKPSSYPLLDQLVDILKEQVELKILLKGHTDNIGNKSSNLQLSLNRARAIQNYLIAKGIKASRISHQGFGSKIPIASNAHPEGRAKNRRVEIVLN